jgi:hypothetical protein
MGVGPGGGAATAMTANSPSKPEAAYAQAEPSAVLAERQPGASSSLEDFSLVGGIAHFKYHSNRAPSILSRRSDF